MCVAVETYSRETLAAYREAPRFVEEHANLERNAVEGGYARRQLFELIQNGSDELIGSRGRVQVVLTADALYCANEGKPLSVRGAGALLMSHLSAKTGVEIGRFGLGFKSVLGITNRPAIYSRSGSIEFDPRVAKKRIEEVVGSVDRVPILRIGLPVDPHEARDSDPVLAELMSWATTVVKLPRDAPDTSWLANDIAEFPEQFLLFSPHVAELALQDLTGDVDRTIRSKRSRGELILEEGTTRTNWRVFDREHEPSDKARLDGGAMADRDRIPLIWAVPTKRGRRGEFWAFFPTLDQTTLSGVVNAPWKLNEDRTRIIEGPFNQELIEEAALVAIEALGELCPEDDPGVLLELVPARGREAAGWADATLTTEFNDRAKYEATVPDQDGELQFPARINLHPPEIPRSVLDLWSRQPSRPTDWAHPSVETRERRARVEMYMDPKGPSSTAEWLEALIGKDRVAGSISALHVASELIASAPSFREEVRAAKILLTEEGEFVSADERKLFVRAPLPLEVEADYLHPEVAAAPTVAGALYALDVHEVGAMRLLSAKVETDSKGWTAEDWDVVWALVRKSPDGDVQRLFEQHGLGRHRLRVRNRDGTYVPLVSVLLPGEIIGNAAEDNEAALDTSFHSEEARLLRALGAVAGPSADDGSRDEPFYAAYERAARNDYLKKLEGSGSAPNTDFLEFRERRFAGPLTPLSSLSARARVHYSTALLAAARDLDPWTFGHKSQSRYPERRYPNPVIWMIKKEGLLATSLGPRTVARAVGPGLADYVDLLPVARCSASAAEALRLPNSIDALGEQHWESLLERLDDLDDDATLAAGYVMACNAGVEAPATLRCRVGTTHDHHEPTEITATADPELARALASIGQPYLAVNSPGLVDALVQKWNLQEAGTSVRKEVRFIPSSEPEPLADVFPLLRLRLTLPQRELLLVRCAELRVEHFTETGRTDSIREFLVEGDSIYVADQLNEAEVLQRVSSALGLDLDEADLDAVLKNLEDQRAVRLRAEIRQAQDNADRLIRAIGADALRTRLSQPLLNAVEAHEGRMTDRDIAELALVVHGVDVLKEHADSLEDRGLAPPQRWAGSRSAVAFVRDLGFPAEFAGFERRRLDRFIEVEGPPALGPLHDYQQIVVDEIRALLRGDDGTRGLLSLPTGAGKTRVTIEALVDSMMEDGLGSPILWVAQTEELCEQAVQAWSEIWRARGPTGTRLTISRLWSNFEADEVEHGHQIVCATIQKLAAGVMAKDHYKWLSKASCLIVDEAHTSIGTAYTKLLDWQGMARRSGRDRAPLVGLTATPFRGSNVEETKRLISRYGSRRLDLAALGSEDAYPHLQRMGILSHVDHDLLAGSELELSDDDLAHLQRFQQLPEGPTRRLGADVARNMTLLESIMTLDETWPVLLFAVSVEHAQTLAALLSREGIRAAAITGDMDRSARRHYIEQYRRGEIRVLTNYGVLTAGFDAPKVRALYVARPTYAPNTYQQMIGRGLRGPRNGGTDRCLLVNVEDNVARFEDRLAFHEFDYLWAPSEVAAS